MTMTLEARREAIEKAMLAFVEEGSAKEAISLPYKDGQGGPYPVISVPVDAVLLNPHSHRIRSQLESHPQRQVVHDAPFSDEAQLVIYTLLKVTEGFEPLKANLSEYGQRDPGVVTRDGLLVNANTRLVALRELGFDYIRAAVLPSDADEHAIDRLELELQVRLDFKQDYTFTNELIFINELLNTHGYSEEKTAKALNWAASSDEKELRRGKERVRQSVRLYAAIRHIQGLSEGAIPLTFFDDKRQALIDLDDKDQALKGSDPDGAERVRNSRIIGLLAGSYYRELRSIDTGHAVDTLLLRLDEKDSLGGEPETLLSSAATPPGQRDEGAALLGGGESATSSDPDLLPLVSLMARSYGKEDVELPSGKTCNRDGLLQEVAEAVGEAAEEVQARKRASRNLSGPVRDLEEAVARARSAAEGFQEVHNTPGFNNGKFKYHTNKLRTQVTALEKLIDNHGQ